MMKVTYNQIIRGACRLTVIALGMLLVACQNATEGSSFERPATFARGVLKHQVFEPADIVIQPEQIVFLLASAELRNPETTQDGTPNLPRYIACPVAADNSVELRFRSANGVAFCRGGISINPKTHQSLETDLGTGDPLLLFDGRSGSGFGARFGGRYVIALQIPQEVSGKAELKQGPSVVFTLKKQGITVIGDPLTDDNNTKLIAEKLISQVPNISSGRVEAAELVTLSCGSGNIAAPHLFNSASTTKGIRCELVPR